MKHFLKLIVLVYFSFLAYSCMHDDVRLADIRINGIQEFDCNSDTSANLRTLGCGAVVEEVSDSLYLLEGDIYLTNEQVEYFDNRQRAAVLTGAVNYWPGAKVYYIIDPQIESMTYTILQAMSQWSYSCGVEFIPRTNQVNYIKFNASNETNVSSSNLGMTGGQQIIKLWPGVSCGIVMHEIGHSLGFFHEHTRLDRDLYVIYHPENVLPGKEHNFVKHSMTGLAGMDFGQFDINSLMMYGSDNFAYDGTYTLTKIDGSPIYQYYLGLSYKDEVASRFLYGPPFVKSTGTQLWEETIVSGNVEYSDAEISNVLTFYEDKDLTTSCTTTSDRMVHIKVVHEGKLWNSDLSRTTSYYTVTIPSGTTSYDLPITEIHEVYVNGDLYTCNSTYYYLSGVGI